MVARLLLPRRSPARECRASVCVRARRTTLSSGKTQAVGPGRHSCAGAATGGFSSVTFVWQRRSGTS
jgi:hypothetical protein